MARTESATRLYNRRKAEGVCVRCGGPIEAERKGRTKCGYCNYRRSEYIRAKSQSKRNWAQRWMSLEINKFPERDTREVLVTDKAGEVFILTKFEGSWSENFRLNGIRAWMYLPDAYKAEE